MISIRVRPYFSATHGHALAHRLAQNFIYIFRYGQIKARERCVSCRIISKLAAVTFSWLAGWLRRKLVGEKCSYPLSGGQKYILKRKKTTTSSAEGTRRYQIQKQRDQLCIPLKSCSITSVAPLRVLLSKSTRPSCKNGAVAKPQYNYLNRLTGYMGSCPFLRLVAFKIVWPRQIASLRQLGVTIAWVRYNSSTQIMAT